MGEVDDVGREPDGTMRTSLSGCTRHSLAAFHDKNLIEIGRKNINVVSLNINLVSYINLLSLMRGS